MPKPQRTDSEFEQVLIRVGLAVFVLLFLLISYEVTGKTENRDTVIIGALFYLAFSISLAIVLRFSTRPSPFRRILATAVDMIMITFSLVVAGDIGAPLYGGYLWGSIANGFRFGKKYLYITQSLAVLGFIYVLATVPFWQEYPIFGAGLLVWLLLIPPYISILLTRVSEAKDKAQRADMAKNHFLANMSHELRTPLTAIIGYSEILGEDMRESGQAKHAKDLKNIHNSGAHLLGLINELLDLSKIEEGRMDVFFEEINIHELSNDVLTTIHPLATKNANQLNVEVMADISTLRTDVTKLRQVLFNLLSNACKFTRDGQITLTICKKVVTKNDSSKDWLEFQVVDNGIGIEPENIDNIFLPFNQENLTTSKSYGGTGLGLTLSRRFCELMGGRLMVKSIKGEGSTFTALLPTMPPAIPTSD